MKKKYVRVRLYFSLIGPVGKAYIVVGLCPLKIMYYLDENYVFKPASA